MTEANTHLGISSELCGHVVSLAEGTATVRLVTTDVMRADAQGLVHGGFVFGLADYAAMLAVNDPNVVLGSAATRFLAPVKVGDEVSATATVRESKGKKRLIEVVARVADRDIMSGTLTAFVLEAHVLG